MHFEFKSSVLSICHNMPEIHPLQYMSSLQMTLLRLTATCISLCKKVTCHSLQVKNVAAKLVNRQAKDSRYQHVPEDDGMSGCKFFPTRGAWGMHKITRKMMSGE